MGIAEKHTNSMTKQLNYFFEKPRPDDVRNYFKIKNIFVTINSTKLSQGKQT